MSRTTFRVLSWAILLGIVATMGMQAYSERPRKNKKNSSFSYYMLVLSYGPDFCAQSNGDKDPRECGAGRNVGFVVHGLWPQGETTRGPENCGPAGTILDALMQQMLNYFPTESLIKHEWATHGTCSGLSMDNYFALVRQARDSVKIPAELTLSSEQSLSPDDIQTKLASANPQILNTAFRTSCYPDKELEEVRICLDKKLSPRACGSSAGRCSLKSVTLLPVH